MTENQSTLKVEGRAGGPLMTVTYVLTDTATGQWAFVDPTYDVAKTWSDRFQSERPPQAIYITHGHFDHVAGLAALHRHYPAAQVWVHPHGKEMIEDGAKNGAEWAALPYEAAAATHFYKEGDTLTLGESKIQVLDAPGHCPGSVLLLSGQQLIAGDVLFQGSVGRWDLPGADFDSLANSIRSKIMTLPDETVVYPGHGPITTVGEERLYNPIVQKILRGERY